VGVLDRDSGPWVDEPTECGPEPVDRLGKELADGVVRMADSVTDGGTDVGVAVGASVDVGVDVSVGVAVGVSGAVSTVSAEGSSAAAAAGAPPMTRATTPSSVTAGRRRLVNRTGRIPLVGRCPVMRFPVEIVSRPAA
jgi:hypothetical protein